MVSTLPKYRDAYRAPEKHRVVFLMLKEELDALDDYGVANNVPSRAAVIKHLLAAGLEAVGAKNKAGITSGDEVHA